MKIPFIKLDGLSEIKSNLKYYVKNFNKPTSWLMDNQYNSLLTESKLEIPGLVLTMSALQPSKTDFENSKRVYETLKFLTDSQASDERLWAALCLGPFWEYMQYRWNDKNGWNESSILVRFFFNSNIRRSMVRNGLSRLWWIARLTYDEKRKDPYELTRLVCEQQRFIADVLERNTSNNLLIIRPFLDAILKARELGKNIDTNDMRNLAKYLNLLGGTYVLDCLPYETIRNKILDRINKIKKAS